MGCSQPCSSCTPIKVMHVTTNCVSIYVVPRVLYSYNIVHTCTCMYMCEDNDITVVCVRVYMYTYMYVCATDSRLLFCDIRLKPHGNSIKLIQNTRKAPSPLPPYVYIHTQCIQTGLQFMNWNLQDALNLCRIWINNYSVRVLFEHEIVYTYNKTYTHVLSPVITTYICKYNHMHTYSGSSRHMFFDLTVVYTNMAHSCHGGQCSSRNL